MGKLQMVGSPALYIGSFYRHTNSDVNSLIALRENMAAIMSGDRLPNLVLAEDFNLPSIDWKNGTIKSPAQYGVEVNQTCLDISRDLFLNQTVHEPTRLNNTLDLIFTTNPDLVNNVQVKPGISDHDSVSVDVPLKADINRKKARTVHLYNKANKDEMEKEIKNFKDQFIATSSERSVQANWEYFKARIGDIVNKYVPTKVLKERVDLPWMNQKIRRLTRKKNKQHMKAKKTKKYKDWKTYRDIQKSVKRKISEAYDKYIAGLFLSLIHI